jgi:predicted GH43/DUF377 family glycosyl hydrolase
MEWIKRGKIFDPTKHSLANDCFEFAQSPQTVVFDDFVRIYFSTRKKDANGKFLSHIAFVDMDKNLSEILNISTHTVIELGGLGCFDEHGIFPISPLKVDNQIYAYTCGWSRRVSVSVETSTGLAISKDNGLTFQKVGTGPILSSSLNEPVLVGDSFVKKYDNIFHMWYIFGKKWMQSQESEPPARIYKIAYATSLDGIEWKKEEAKQIIADKLNSEECQALPSVIKIGETYHMYFCYREATDFRKNSGRGYRIGYAFSEDLVNWTRDDENIGLEMSENEWDSEMMCYPHVFEVENKIYLLYNGNEFGKYGFGLAQLKR